MRTKVVSITTGDYFDVYIGRGMLHRGLEGSPFHNPFRLTDYPLKDPVDQRFKCLVAFAQYFYSKIDEEPEFLRQVLNLRGKVLGCWCKPKACHGDIIAHFVDEIAKEVVL